MRFLGMICLLAALSACSWQKTVHELGQVPAHTRMQNHAWVTDAPRFRLPPQARLSVASGDGTPQPWLTAANAGVQGVFGGSSGPSFALRVDWPEVSYAAAALESRTVAAGLFGVLEMPQVPPRQHLDVWLLDAQGETLAGMKMHISPKWWGPTWQEPELLEASFRQLATVLAGR